MLVPCRKIIQKLRPHGYISNTHRGDKNTYKNLDGKPGDCLQEVNTNLDLQGNKV
jgi:hypothetical protein